VRLLFVNQNRSLSYGGVERWMIDAASGLAARGHDAVMLGRPRTAWLDAARAAGLRVRADIHGTWAARVLRMRAAMRAERPDVVVTKGKKAARWAAFGRATGGGGRVVLFFGLTHELARNRWIDRFTWRRMDAGIVVAHGAADWYVAEGFGPREKVHVLWKGVELPRFDAAHAGASALRAALGIGPDDVAIGMVGRLAWQKGIDDLFAAVKIVHPRVPRARFFVVGGGRDADAVAAAAAELNGAVTLLGQRDDVPELLAAMDIVVQSSRREVMAQTTLEAMAVGRPDRVGRPPSARTKRSRTARAASSCRSGTRPRWPIASSRSPRIATGVSRSGAPRASASPSTSRARTCSTAARRSSARSSADVTRFLARRSMI
jgi:glycosyltransferase involved in cell wall biosynthesis